MDPAAGLKVCYSVEQDRGKLAPQDLQVAAHCPALEKPFRECCMPLSCFLHPVCLALLACNRSSAADVGPWPEKHFQEACSVLVWQVASLEGAGHYPYIEQPQRFMQKLLEQLRPYLQNGKGIDISA